ncbi:MAG: hypothetical protein A2277_19520 [Desulfobacterales bacterium RIFOXYA12_FULL_46_15]|nr:MAG: hypothetical protein A2097_00025 [Desulfobacula sp. GWF2_41_7]OGR25173.1 MAG: hypothetical protein A2277_19520 [Desulfobacterales bacterium RIFOXYA12_FULL_46_15]
MKIITKTSFIIILCVTFIFQGYGLSEEKKLIAVFTTWEPYGYMENNTAAGFEIEIFAAVAKKMEIAVEFLNRPWKRCLYSMENKTADVVISALKTKDRESYLIYPEEPISIGRTGFFTTVEKNIVFNGTFEPLTEFTIGITSGFSYGDAFDSAAFLKKDESTETPTIITKVLLGRIDLGIGDIAVIKTAARKEKILEKIKFLEPLVHSRKLYAAFSKKPGHEILSMEFSKALSEFRTSEEYYSILKKYGIEEK